MACRHPRVSICLLLTIILALTDHVRSAGGDHYPDEKYNRKPCFRRKNTVKFQGPICQLAPGGYTPESQKNCEDTFRTSECPELNFAECQTMLSNPGRKYTGVCNMCYRAENDLWAYITYMNQYIGAPFDKEPVWDIIEYDRGIKKTAAFGDRQQPFWPSNVIDPEGNRGLKWITPAQFDLPTLDTKTAICAGVENAGSVTDDRCSKILSDYLYKQVTSNIETILKDNPIEMNTFEKDHNANITYEINNQCRNIVIPNRTRVPACQATFVRRSRCSYETNEGNSSLAPVTKVHDTSFEFLEYQVFNKPENNYSIRYAFWNLEPTETRDEIFSNGA